MLAGERPALDVLDLALTRAAVRRGLFEEAAPPPKIGRFDVQGRIGVGGMGRVFRARDPELDRVVAVKLIQDDAEGTDPGAPEELRTRLLREARALAQLAHPNVVTVFESGTTGDEVFIAMEFVQGRDLRRLLNSKPTLPWRTTLDIFVQAARGLQAAHAAGIVHRDFKPENVLVGDDGRVRVADFGLARPGAAAEPDESGPEELASDADAVTHPGAGTPGYFAPERRRGRPADAKSDQYSFCVAAYEAFTGDRPGPEPSFDTSSSVPGWIQRAIKTGLAAEPEDRHPDMAALIAALEHVPAFRRPVTWIGGAALAIAATAIIVARPGPDPCGGFEAQLEGTWNADTRRELGTTFGHGGVAYLEALGEATASKLDRFATDWVAERTDACVASRTRKEQSERIRGLRVACLDGQRHEFAATVELLLDGDPNVLKRAPALLAELGPLAACSDVGAIETAEDFDPQAESSRAVLELLTRARTEQVGGRYEEAKALAEEGLAKAKETESQALEARALALVGATEVKLGDDSAEEHLRDAVWAAEASHADATAADGWLSLAGLIGDRRGKVDEAKDEVERASAAVVRLGDDRVRARLLRLRARLEVKAGRPAAALEILEEAKPVYSEAFPPEHPNHAALLDTLGSVHFGLARYDDAALAFSKAIEIRARSHGRGHPKVSNLMGNLATAYVAGGKNEDAIPILEEAIEILKASVGPHRTPRDLGNLLNALGAAHDQLGHDGEALDMYRAALEASRGVHDDSHPEVLSARTNVARLLGRLGRHDEASAELEVVLAQRIAVHGERHPVIAEPLTSLGTLASKQGHHARALELHDRALAIREKANGDDHVDTAYGHHNVGEALERLGRAKEAHAHAALAVATFERLLDGGHPYVGLASLALARDELALGRRANAERRARTAIEILSGGGDVEHGHARFVLAKALDAVDPVAAREQAERADELLAGQCDAAPGLCAELEAWMQGRTRSVKRRVNQ